MRVLAILCAISGVPLTVTYDAYLKKVYNDRDELAAATAKGIAQGRDEGRRDVALEMLRDNEPDSKILKYAKITPEELVGLKQVLGLTD